MLHNVLLYVQFCRILLCEARGEILRLAQSQVLVSPDPPTEGRHPLPLSRLDGRVNDQ